MSSAINVSRTFVIIIITQMVVEKVNLEIHESINCSIVTFERVLISTIFVRLMITVWLNLPYFMLWK